MLLTLVQSTEITTECWNLIGYVSPLTMGCKCLRGSVVGQVRLEADSDAQAAIMEANGIAAEARQQHLAALTAKESMERDYIEKLEEASKASAKLDCKHASVQTNIEDAPPDRVSSSNSIATQTDEQLRDGSTKQRHGDRECGIADNDVINHSCSSAHASAPAHAASIDETCNKQDAVVQTNTPSSTEDEKPGELQRESLQPRFQPYAMPTFMDGGLAIENDVMSHGDTVQYSPSDDEPLLASPKLQAGSACHSTDVLHEGPVRVGCSKRSQNKVAETLRQASREWKSDCRILAAHTDEKASRGCTSASDISISSTGDAKMMADDIPKVEMWIDQPCPALINPTESRSQPDWGLLNTCQGVIDGRPLQDATNKTLNTGHAARQFSPLKEKASQPLTAMTTDERRPWRPRFANRDSRNSSISTGSAASCNAAQDVGIHAVDGECGGHKEAAEEACHVEATYQQGTLGFKALSVGEHDKVMAGSDESRNVQDTQETAFSGSAKMKRDAAVPQKHSDGTSSPHIKSTSSCAHTTGALLVHDGKENAEPLCNSSRTSMQCSTHSFSFGRVDDRAGNRIHSLVSPHRSRSLKPFGQRFHLVDENKTYRASPSMDNRDERHLFQLNGMESRWSAEEPGSHRSKEDTPSVRHGGSSPRLPESTKCVKSTEIGHSCRARYQFNVRTKCFPCCGFACTRRESRVVETLDDLCVCDIFVGSRKKWGRRNVYQALPAALETIFVPLNKIACFNFPRPETAKTVAERIPWKCTDDDNIGSRGFAASVVVNEVFHLLAASVEESLVRILVLQVGERVGMHIELTHIKSSKLFPYFDLQCI